MAVARFRRRFAQVESFLRSCAPSDVLMPSACKAPIFPHRGGRWTWRSYDRFIAVDGQCPDDACVLLDQLCVVDVDTTKQATDLEAAFPCLAEVPCEATARGRHYWFRRSARADALGYFDGAGQRVHGIDFKTRCSTGTAGIVVVAPSAGKVWIRPLHDSILEPIPDDLLDAVAVPKCLVRAYDLEFTCGVSATIETSHLGSMAYFEPFLDEECELGIGTRIPVPCDERSMRSLLEVYDTVQQADPYARPLPSGASFAAAFKLVDKLGGDAAGLRERLVRGPTLWRADLRTSWPAMDDALAIEHALGSAAVRYIEVGSAIRYEPALCSCADSTWLFSDDRTKRHFEGDTVSPSFLPSDVEAALPEIVRTAMRRHRLVLAGGAALAMMSPRVLAASGGAVADWDLFPYGVDEDTADAILRDVESTMDGWRAIRTPRAFTFVCPPSETTVPSMISAVQVVLRLSETPADVLTAFDIAPCKVALFYDDTCCLRAIATPSWFESMRRMAFPVPIDRWCKSSSLRVIKYIARGFDAMLPGVRRTFAKQRQRLNTNGVRVGGGLSVLLVAETITGGCRPFHKSLWLLQRVMAQQCGTKVWSNYESLVKARGPLSLIYAVCMAAVGLVCKLKPDGPTQWRRDGDVIGRESARLWNVHPTGCHDFVESAWAMLTSHDTMQSCQER